MVKIKIDIQNNTEIESFLQQLVDDMGPERNKEEILAVLQSEMKSKRASIPLDTGQLRASLTGTTKDTHYAVTKKTVEFGVKASCPQGYWQLYYHRKRKDLIPDKKGQKIAKAIISSVSGG